MVHEKVTLLVDKGGRSVKHASCVANYLIDKQNIDTNLVTFENRPFLNGEPQRVLGDVPLGRCFLFSDPEKDPVVWKDEMTEVVDYLNNSADAFVSEVTLVIPYYYYGRQDHLADKDPSRARSIMNARRVAMELSCGIDRVILCDLHAEQIAGFFGRGVRVTHFNSLPAVAEYFSRRRKFLKDLDVASTDAGGLKRVELFQKIMQEEYGIELGLVPIHKLTRPCAQQTAGVILGGKVKQRRILLLDDILGTGGTVRDCEKALREGGATEVYVYGTFGEFNKGFEKFSEFDGVYVSDALPNKYPGKVKVIPLGKSIAEAVYSTLHESVSRRRH